MTKEKLLIDVSHHNDNIDFAKVKADPQGVSGVIIRAGFGRYVSQKDKRFDKNYAGASSAGLDVGTYWYSYATNKNEALSEAKACAKIIAGKKFSYPVYFDIEDKCQLYLPKEVCSDMVKTFCDYLEERGFFAGVYSYDSFFSSNLKTDIPKRYSAWVARVNSAGASVIKPTHCKVYAMHQYSWNGAVSGIKGSVDMNLCFKDFPAIMASKGINGFSVNN
ncbi:MAG: glycoside hydrolase family 25 protein [Ruminococcus sp.]|jgi:GH25 family lysozyme M1 (1,4-beta-N-acetylmuramidase)|nr:glycoside hydrolase family 25 protein [Ruminococcus sp.]